MNHTRTIGQYRIIMTRQGNAIEYRIWDTKDCRYVYIGTSKAKAKNAMKEKV